MSESVEMPVEKSSLGSVGAHFKSLCVLRGWGGGGGGSVTNTAFRAHGRVAWRREGVVPLGELRRTPFSFDCLYHCARRCCCAVEFPPLLGCWCVALDACAGWAWLITWVGVTDHVGGCG